MGKLGESAPYGAELSAARGWQREDTRQAVLDAARRICAQKGIEDLSLNVVAKEAGYSTSTVFAYFGTKNDLFLAVLADDLAMLAARMRGHFPHHEIEENSSAFTDLQAPKESETNPLPFPQAAERGEPDIDTAMVASPLKVEFGEKQAAAVQPVVGEQVQLAPTAKEVAEQAPHQIDAWLARRLRVFEKNLSDVETRLSTTEKDSTRALTLAEDSTRIFGARLDAENKRVAQLTEDVGSRLATVEKRLKDTGSDLRASLLNACSRIDILEAETRKVIAIAAVQIPTPAAEEHQPIVEPVVEQSQAEPDPTSADAYILAARRAARIASTMTKAEEAPVIAIDRKALPRMPNPRKYILALGATIAMFLAGGMTSYAVGLHVGRTTPIYVTGPLNTLHGKPVRTSGVLTPLDQLSSLANSGDAKAELIVGLKYLRGQNTAVNEPLAATWIAKSADRHEPMAEYWLAKLYASGEGVPSDASQSLRWYETAADHGNRQAMHDIGMAYAQGIGAQKDYSEAARWFLRAAELGLINSQFNLAVMYERGEGVPQSLIDAYKWYAIAAANGDGESKKRIDVLSTQLNADDLDAAKDSALSFVPGRIDRNANLLPQMPAFPKA